MTTKTPKSEAPHAGPAHLDTGARSQVCGALRGTLIDAIDLHTQIKVAHWNIQGPHFAALHPLFDTYAQALAAFVDEVAERIRVLGELSVGTARHVAAHSRLEEYPQDVTRDMAHVELLLQRFEAFLAGATAARSACEQHGDTDSADLLTQVITDFDKHAWFLRATLGG